MPGPAEKSSVCMSGKAKKYSLCLVGPAEKYSLFLSCPAEKIAVCPPGTYACLCEFKPVGEGSASVTKMRKVINMKDLYIPAVNYYINLRTAPSSRGNVLSPKGYILKNLGFGAKTPVKATTFINNPV